MNNFTLHLIQDRIARELEKQRLELSVHFCTLKLISKNRFEFRHNLIREYRHKNMKKALPRTIHEL